MWPTGGSSLLKPRMKLSPPNLVREGRGRRDLDDGGGGGRWERVARRVAAFR